MRTSSIATPTERPVAAHRAGFTLIEAIVMTVLLGLLTGMVMLNISGFAFSSRTSMETAELVSTLRKAYSSAIQGSQRFEVRLDLAQQSYVLRELTPSNYGQPPEQQEILDERKLDDQCRIEYIEFDDGVATDQDFNVANFRAGHAGWQRGGRILITDSSGTESSIMVNRLTGAVTVEKGNVPLLVTQSDTSQQ